MRTNIAGIVQWLKVQERRDRPRILWQRLPESQPHMAEPEDRVDDAQSVQVVQCVRNWLSTFLDSKPGFCD